MTIAETETKTLGQKATDRFTEMMIKYMEQMKSVGWHKEWIGGATAPGAMPQNVSGRGYSGSNSFSLQPDMAPRGYPMPAYPTFKQASGVGVYVRKSESIMPMLYQDIMARDKDGKRVSRKAYRKTSFAEQVQVQIIPFLKVFNVFNVDQTNLAEVRPDKIEALKKLFAPPKLRNAEGTFTGKALDRMFEKQGWICPIQCDKQVPGTYSSPSRDIIVISKKKQFNISKTLEEVYKDGMEHYSAALHEMARSVGTEPRLNRGSCEEFGDAKHVREGLVAKLVAAMAGSSMDFGGHILDNNATYLDSWISTLKENPKLIVSVVADVNGATNMVLEGVGRQKMALGEEPLFSKDRNLSNDIPKDKAVSRSVSIIKQNDGSYAA